MEPARSFQLHLAKQHDLLVALEYLMKERLVEPDRARHAAGVAEQQLEDLEAGRRVDRRWQLRISPTTEVVSPGLRLEIS